MLSDILGVALDKPVHHKGTQERGKDIHLQGTCQRDREWTLVPVLFMYLVLGPS